MLSKSEPGTHGVDLVDRAFDAKKGTLRFSQHSGEQEGAKLLYRGAIMFIRNPPMHRLVQYAQRYAEAGIELIDALLQLLEAPDREDC
jgi:hypothetical protein